MGRFRRETEGRINERIDVGQGSLPGMGQQGSGQGSKSIIPNGRVRAPYRRWVFRVI